MNTICCAAVFLLAVQPRPDYSDRERHPLAPSLPRLTKDEYAKIDTAIDRFVLYDIGKLKGAEGKNALDDFNRLGSESIFNLIDGLNRAANMESSCPAVIISKRVASILLSTEDMELLKFAQYNIGADVTAKRHLGVLKDLQATILLRKGTLQRRTLAGGAKAVSAMSFAELETAIGKTSGTQLKSLLAETERRQGAKAVDLLLLGMASDSPDITKYSQGLLTKNLLRQPGDVLKAMLKHERREVRIAAAGAIGARRLRFGSELIGLLLDSEHDARQAARRALGQISGGTDHGPSADASFTEREASVARWREWWARQK
ncbi:MAG: hypothetical protein EXR98_09770 [Gemmataceae bacterium]|nr:hypothetical protein [Gemmataceae bacterium]